MLDPVYLLNQLCGRQPSNNAAEATEQAPVLDADSLPSRYRAYGILYTAGIPQCIWFEDALEHFGVPTMTFCLYLLVPDERLSQAAEHLLRAGYKKRRPMLALDPIPQFENMYGLPNDPMTELDEEGLLPLDPEEIVDAASPPVVLLPASEWCYTLPRTVMEMDDCYPTLPEFLTSMIAKWFALTEADEMLRLHLTVQISYMYEYLDAVKEPGFEKNLPERFRKFHFDGINMEEGEREWSLLSAQKRYLEEMQGTGNANEEREGEWQRV